MAIVEGFRKDTRTVIPSSFGAAYTFYGGKFMGRSSGGVAMTQHNKKVSLLFAQGADGEARVTSWWQITIDYVDLSTDFYSFINPSIIKRSIDSESFAIEVQDFYRDMSEDKKRLQIMLIENDGYTAKTDLRNVISIYGAYVLRQEEQTLFNFGIENRKVYRVVFVAPLFYLETKATGNRTEIAASGLEIPKKYRRGLRRIWRGQRASSNKKK